MLSLIIIILIAISVIWKMRIGGLFAPWTVNLLLWLGILVLLSISGNLLYPVGHKFIYCLSLWIPIFTLSSVLTYYSFATDEEAKVVYGKSDFNQNLFNAMFALSCVITPLYVYYIFKLVLLFDTDEIFYNLRILAVQGNNSGWLLSHSYILNLVLFIVALWQYPKVQKWKIGVICTACIAGQIAIMEKSGFFLMTIAASVILYSKQKISIRAIIITFAVLLVLFFAISYLVSNGGQSEFHFIDFLGIYIISPSVAFDYVNEGFSYQIGANTFDYFHHLIANSKVSTFDKVQRWVFIPLPTNVYSIFQPFYQDAAYKGVAFFAMLYGVIYGLSYRLFRTNSLWAHCVYCYMVYALVMEFYLEQFFSSFAMFLQIVILSALLTVTCFTFNSKQM